MTQPETSQEIKQDTKQLILDAAEGLFAREGFHNTSLRAITGEAGVNLAAVNYHFGSKEALLEKVFARRLLPLNEIRRAKLMGVRERARLEDRRPGVEEILRAFIEPTLGFRDSGPGAEEFITLVGRAISDPDDTMRNIFLRQVESLFFLLWESLREALPDMSRDELFWRLQFVFGAMSHTMCKAGKLQLVPEGVSQACSTEFLTKMLMVFVTAGMEAP
jgi:AcrR family transcriptional regulator